MKIGRDVLIGKECTGSGICPMVRVSVNAVKPSGFITIMSVQER
jgi:hypothetical protein